MKNTIEAEDLRNLNYAPFSEPLAGPIELPNGRSEAVSKESPEGALLELFLTAVKWVFLFLPGAAVIHLIMLGFALLFFYGDWSFELVGASIAIMIFGAFMTMIGIGKLRDLRYLRVAGSIFAMGGLAAVIYSILIMFIPGDFFDLFAKLTLPLTVLAGCMVKRDTDRKSETE